MDIQELAQLFDKYCSRKDEGIPLMSFNEFIDFFNEFMTTMEKRHSTDPTTLN